jgi:hypothetical protein
MLISIPTETSTIFGVFQAILALSLLTGRTPPWQVNLVRNENFASKIFSCGRVYSYGALQKLFTFSCGLVPKQRQINSFRAVRGGRNARSRIWRRPANSG